MIDYHAGMKARAKFAVKVTQNPNGKYSTLSELPMHSADTNVSQDFAFHAMRAANAMLDFSKSDLRLVFYDVVKKEYVAVKEKE